MEWDYSKSGIRYSPQGDPNEFKGTPQRQPRHEPNASLRKTVARLRSELLVQALEGLEDYGMLDMFLDSNKETVARLQELLKGRRG